MRCAANIVTCPGTRAIRSHRIHFAYIFSSISASAAITISIRIL